jgi:hypothetical protein
MNMQELADHLAALGGEKYRAVRILESLRAAEQHAFEMAARIFDGGAPNDICSAEWAASAIRERAAVQVKPGPSLLLRAFRQQLLDAALEYGYVTEDRQSEGSPLVAGSMLRLAAKAFWRQMLADRALRGGSDRCDLGDEHSSVRATSGGERIPE